MKTCRCGREYRSGRLAYVKDEQDASKLVRARVCRKCADSALTIVLDNPPAKEVKHEVRNPQLDAMKRRIVAFRNQDQVTLNDADARERTEAYNRCLALVDAAQEGRPL